MRFIVVASDVPKSTSGSTFGCAYHEEVYRLSRRRLLAQLLPAAVGRAAKTDNKTENESNPGPPLAPPANAGLSPDEDRFLNDLEYANFRFFWEQSSPLTGLTKDRTDVRNGDRNVLASIAATGFALTALCIGEKRGFISYPQARDRALATLRSILNWQPNHRGFFFHWLNIDTGERILESEVSSVDTAILLCGILTCRAHFHDDQINTLATQIFNRVEWSWLSEDTTLLPHGWTPEGGFLPYRWDYYSELMMMYLLGLGSPTYPLPQNAWNSWKRLTFEYHGIRYIGSFAPLFIHQYSQAWFDFRGKHDFYADYFNNSGVATDVHRLFCLDLAKEFPSYSDDLWGISASDSMNGYQAWGGPPRTGPIDGTVVPSATAGSLPFRPRETLRVLRNIRDKYSAAWSRYGFVNAFNPRKNWYDKDVVGIDTGITMLMAENLRSGFVWDTFMRNPEARVGMDRAGFRANQPAGSNAKAPASR
jgi:hypothetical protein